MRKLVAVLMFTFAPAGVWGQTGNPGAPATTASIESGAPPAHPATEDQIREYLSLLGVEKVAHEMLNSELRAMQATAAPYYPASFWTDMNDSFQKLDITAVYLSLYQKYVSREEMQASIDFYRSPAGKKMLAMQPMIIRDAQAVLRQRGGEVGAAVYARHKDEIEAAKKSYEQQHSTAPEITIPK
jgi:uncharacterized protein